MRHLQTALAVLAIPVMAALVVVGGRTIKSHESVMTVDQIDPIADALPTAGGDALSAPDTAQEPVTSAVPAPEPPSPAMHSRAIDPGTVAPPDLSDQELQRVEPRAPLSDLALAGPPKPPKTKMPGDWNGTKLFQPVAAAAGLIEGKGYAVAVSGVDVVKTDETCSDEGKDWACGARARTAFRAFLRGRAVACALPPGGGRDIISAECHIGNQDVGQWLVENGWARAAQGGPYVEAGNKARTARKGIFGPAPDLGGLPTLPAASEPAPVAPESILQDDGADATPPVDRPAPAQ